MSRHNNIQQQSIAREYFDHGKSLFFNEGSDDEEDNERLTIQEHRIELEKRRRELENRERRHERELERFRLEKEEIARQKEFMGNCVQMMKDFELMKNTVMSKCTMLEGDMKSMCELFEEQQRAMNV
jgi:hypothetical protein